MSVHDVFVSYAHADNELAEGSSAKFGWVITLAQNLNTGPGHYKKDLFIDHRLRPGDVFSDDLIEKVRHSRLLLLLLSQNYIDSQWCGKELDHFVRTHAKDPNKPTDVFVIELVPYEELERVPVNIQNLRKHVINAKFWHQPADGSTPLLAGDPTPDASGLEKHYWRVLRELRAAIDRRLRAIAAGETSNGAQIQPAGRAREPSHTK